MRDRCEGCNYSKDRCLCGQHPVAVFQKKKLYALEDFLKFMEVNHGRKATKITVEFQHKRFPDNTGFAVLEMEGQEMYNIVRALNNEVAQQKQNINGTIIIAND